ncbi:Molybdopterin converting factor, small subunit [Halobiforma haloterrestris]|uniref:Molybdopterin converting factor, small subunit n=1 Tax=Natronobacterium haloterrestre TaxID=148448 RepID=A0A1I1DR40_NATHA|nr:MoaD/ThiS family protein [Halobiforma haloterrestris]SFB75508.1 Molybdopterin converting factor, small subunit [Halobiforma haloterrestris]
MSADATSQEPGSESDRERSTEATTTVEVRCTGHVREAVGTHDLEFAFEGDRLRDFLEAFFAEYDVEEMLIAETEDEATAHGWAEPPEELPGTWRKNPEGEQTRPYARVCINGRFNEHYEGFETELEDGDRVALIYPFMFCC